MSVTSRIMQALRSVLRLGNRTDSIPESATSKILKEVSKIHTSNGFPIFGYPRTGSTSGPKTVLPVYIKDSKASNAKSRPDNVDKLEMKAASPGTKSDKKVPKLVMIVTPNKALMSGDKQSEGMRPFKKPGGGNFGNPKSKIVKRSILGKKQSTLGEKPDRHVPFGMHSTPENKSVKERGKNYPNIVMVVTPDKALISGIKQSKQPNKKPEEKLASGNFEENLKSENPSSNKSETDIDKAGPSLALTKVDKVMVVPVGQSSSERPHTESQSETVKPFVEQEVETLDPSYFKKCSELKPVKSDALIGVPEGLKGLPVIAKADKPEGEQGKEGTAIDRVGKEDSLGKRSETDVQKVSDDEQCPSGSTSDKIVLEDEALKISSESEIDSKVQSTDPVTESDQQANAKSSETSSEKAEVAAENCCDEECGPENAKSTQSQSEIEKSVPSAAAVKAAKAEAPAKTEDHVAVAGPAITSSMEKPIADKQIETHEKPTEISKPPDVTKDAKPAAVAQTSSNTEPSVQPAASEQPEPPMPKQDTPSTATIYPRPAPVLKAVKPHIPLIKFRKGGLPSPAPAATPVVQSSTPPLAAAPSGPNPWAATSVTTSEWYDVPQKFRRRQIDEVECDAINMGGPDVPYQ